ncbi:MAG: CAP domain-containing protein, partial [Candidatus Acidiferrum sp.]
DTNRERVARGLQPLHWDATLALAARDHARLMAVENLLSHQCPGEPPLEQRVAQAGAKFSMIAENVAVGPDPASIHDGWMHSPGHRKNILNAEVTAVGIATIRGSGGLFAVQDFSRPVASLSLQQQEGKVISLLKETALLGANVSEDARKTCGMDRGYAGVSALYVIRFEVTDLDKLPDQLLQKIRSRKYQNAAVGACRDGDNGGFTRYRIAVLLR